MWSSAFSLAFTPPLHPGQRHGVIDAIAIETMPDLDEVEALVACMKKHYPDVAFYVSFQVGRVLPAAFYLRAYLHLNI